MKKFVIVLAVLAIVPSVFLSSCKKTVDCPGVPEQMEGYFPSVSELKLSNGLGDTLFFPIQEYTRALPRTVSNNPLSVGGTGGTPICFETLSAESFIMPIDCKFELKILESEKKTQIRFSIHEESAYYNFFDVEVNETPSSLGDYKVFGDTLNLSLIHI
jgi:hypothetical protein